jgi:hypothetical protein
MQLAGKRLGASVQAISVFLLALGSQSTTALAQSTGGFTATGDMVAARYGHTATLLADGKVLIAGGRSWGNNSFLAGAELYDPSEGTFSVTGDMTAARYWPSATLLPDGRVFIAGGSGKDGPLASAEIYDPSTGVFSAAGNMSTAQYLYTATLLPNGSVLVLAYLPGTAGWTAASYDPSTQTFTATGPGPGITQNATLLPDGRVFFDGGTDIQGAFTGAQLYDPATRTFTPVGAGPPDPGACCGFSNTATLLTNGDVLLTGGGNGDWGIAFNNAALYDPVSGTLIPTGSMANRRFGHKTTLLADGTALITGGLSGCPPQGGFCGGVNAGAEIYDPSTGAFRPAGSMAMARELHTSTLLLNGTVLIAGGAVWGQVLATAELYSPPSSQAAPYSFIARKNLR